MSFIDGCLVLKIEDDSSELIAYWTRNKENAFIMLGLLFPLHWLRISKIQMLTTSQEATNLFSKKLFPHSFRMRLVPKRTNVFIPSLLKDTKITWELTEENPIKFNVERKGWKYQYKHRKKIKIKKEKPIPVVVKRSTLADYIDMKCYDKGLFANHTLLKGHKIYYHGRVVENDSNNTRFTMRDGNVIFEAYQNLKEATENGKLAAYANSGSWKTQKMKLPKTFKCTANCSIHGVRFGNPYIETKRIIHEGEELFANYCSSAKFYFKSDTEQNLKKKRKLKVLSKRKFPPKEPRHCIQNNSRKRIKAIDNNLSESFYLLGTHKILESKQNDEFKIGQLENYAFIARNLFASIICDKILKNPSHPDVSRLINFSLHNEITGMMGISKSHLLKLNWKFDTSLNEMKFALILNASRKNIEIQLQSTKTIILEYGSIIIIRSMTKPVMFRIHGEGNPLIFNAIKKS